MSISVPTPENLKTKAKVARQFLQEKCGVNVSHSQSIELLSQVFGFKDWNTAKAELSHFEQLQFLASIRSKKQEIPLSVQGMTVGEVRKALESYPDSATIDADYEFNLGEYINSIDELSTPEDTIHQEFAFVEVGKVSADYVSLKLTLKEESFSTNL